MVQRTGRSKPLADLIDACLGRTLAAQGFAASDIVIAWPDIVGARLAGFAQPIRIEWPRRRPGADPASRSEPATLIVRVESAFALELQHLAPVIVERVNSHYGWRCVGRLVLKQGPVRRPPVPAAAPSLAEEDRRRIAEAVAAVDEEGLRGALERLGRAVVASGAGARPPTKA